MTDQAIDLEREVLDCLLDSAESPWIIHTEIRRHSDPEVSVDDVIGAVGNLERLGLVQQEHAAENFDEALAEYRRYAASPRWQERALFQEYGPWYAITDSGRAAFSNR